MKSLPDLPFREQSGHPALAADWEVYLANTRASVPMPRWIVLTLRVAVAIGGAAIWSVITAGLGAPVVIVALGAVAVGAMLLLFGDPG